MSERFPGGFVTMTPPTVSLTSASGVWTVDQAMANQQAGVWPFGGPFVYVEDVFSTYLYTGNNSTQTITNGIDLATKGGLVWVKGRNSSSGGSAENMVFDTARGAGYRLVTNNTSASYNSGGNYLTSFNSSGFSINNFDTSLSVSGINYVSWTFRKQPKFFDVVTYTGNGVAGRTVAHNLGSTPGCIIVKRTDTTADWEVYHRGLDSTLPEKYQIYLNATNARQSSTARWNDTAPTATQFTLGTWAGVNANGGTYVAYLFAHNAGGFGLTGTDNVISCGSFTTGSTGLATVTLGWEPQFFLVKNLAAGYDWEIVDTMRGWIDDGTGGSGKDARLFPNLSNAEDATLNRGNPSPTGMELSGFGGSMTYIYIAIRRGPMKKPVSGTSVYAGVTRTGTGAAATTTSAGFPVDLAIVSPRDQSGGARAGAFFDRLRGADVRLASYSTSQEITAQSEITSFASMDGVSYGTSSGAWTNVGGTPYINWFFRRAPGVMDVVGFTGTGADRSVAHNLGVVPELIILKNRTSVNVVENYWLIGTNFGASTYRRNWLQTTEAGTSYAYSAGAGFSAAPTATTFSVTGAYNTSTNPIVAYLFASCPGVSKVGSYTGNGSSLTVNCGFSGGARFILIKRVDSTGDWLVWDTARGIVAANDPYLRLNSTAAEFAGDDSVDADSTGFIVNQNVNTNINVSSATYIYLAFA